MHELLKTVHNVLEREEFIKPLLKVCAERTETLKEEFSRMSIRKRRKVSLAYLLLKGINDSFQDLMGIARLAKELGVGITLLRYNMTREGYEDVGDLAYEEAFLFLRSCGIRVTLSTRFRRNRLGGCGTLVVNRVLEGV